MGWRAEPVAVSLSFTYHRSLAPMMWVLIGLGIVELLLGHFLIALWNVTVALILSVLTLAMLIWLVLLIRSFKRLPVIVDQDEILFRTGTLGPTRVAIANIAPVQRHFPGEALKDKSVLNLGMMSYPNVLVGLREPQPRRRGQALTAVAHCLDDPDAFVATIAEVRRLGSKPTIGLERDDG